MSLDIMRDLIVKWNVSERNFIWKWPLKKPWLRKRGNSWEGENACIYFGSDVHSPPLCLSTHYPQLQTGQTVQHFPLETRPVLAQPRIWTMISPSLFLVKLSYHYSFLDISNMPLPYHLICVFPLLTRLLLLFLGGWPCWLDRSHPNLSVSGTWTDEHICRHWNKQMRLLTAGGDWPQNSRWLGIT